MELLGKTIKEKGNFLHPILNHIFSDQRTIPMCKINAYPCSSHEVDTDMVDEEETKEDTDVEIEEELETFIELSSKEWNDNIALLEGEGTDVEMVEKEETSE